MWRRREQLSTPLPMAASREAMIARDLVAGYEEAMEKVGPTVRSVVQKEVEDISVSLEERIRELAQGYTRLNQLALEAPLGLASLAATHHSRLSSFGLSDQCNDTAVEGWDDQKHREVLWETREAKMLLDAHYKAELPSKKMGRTLTRVPGAKFSSARPPIFDRDRRKPVSDSTSPIALRKYRGGFHGEHSSLDPAGPLEQREEQQRKEPRRKATAPKINSKRTAPVRIVVKESNADLAKATKESIGAATAAAKRAAAAAEKAAEAAARAAAHEAPPPSPLLERNTTILDEPVAEYRILAPRRAVAEMAGVDPVLLPSAQNHPPGSEPVPPQPAPPQPAQSERPALRLDSDLYLAQPTDASESIPSVVRRPGTARCVEPGLGFMEDERVRALTGAPAVWIPNGRRAPEAMPTGGPRDPPQSAAKHGANEAAMPPLPPARTDTAFDSPFTSDPHSRDCARLVTRIMLAQAQREPHGQCSAAKSPGAPPTPPRGAPPTPPRGAPPTPPPPPPSDELGAAASPEGQGIDVQATPEG